MPQSEDGLILVNKVRANKGYNYKQETFNRAGIIAQVIQKDLPFYWLPKATPKLFVNIL